MSVKTIVLSDKIQLVEHNSDVNKLIRVDDEKSSASFWGIAIFDVMYYLHVYLRVSMEHSVESNHNTS